MGSFNGHALPGALLVIAGALFPLQILLQMPHGDRLRLFSLGAMAVVGPLIEISWEDSPNKQVAQSTPHDVMYFAYMFFGACSLLECFGRLPQKSSEASMGLACAIQCASFFSHISMQEGVERRMHAVVAAFAGLSTLSFLACLLHPSDRIHLFAWASLQVQGFWYLYIAVEYFDPVDGTRHMDLLGLFPTQILPKGLDDPMADMLVVPHASILVLIVASSYVAGLAASHTRIVLPALPLAYDLKTSSDAAADEAQGFCGHASVETEAAL